MYIYLMAENSPKSLMYGNWAITLNCAHCDTEYESPESLGHHELGDGSVALNCTNCNSAIAFAERKSVPLAEWRARLGPGVPRTPAADSFAKMVEVAKRISESSLPFAWTPKGNLVALDEAEHSRLRRPDDVCGYCGKTTEYPCEGVPQVRACEHGDPEIVGWPA